MDTTKKQRNVKNMKVGILTGGGDAPGLNAVIYGILLKARDLGHEVIGITRGWKGFLDNLTMDLDVTKLNDLHVQGGTILYTSRTNPFKPINVNPKNMEGHEAEVKEYVQDVLIPQFDVLGIDALITIGGDDTLSVAARIAENCDKIVIGVPKTIDNDLTGTDYTFGFWTSVQLATSTLDNLQTTTRAHQRVLLVEVMGRNAGWLTLMSGVASGADLIIMPEQPFDVQKDLIDILIQRAQTGYVFHIIAISEGAVPTDDSLLNFCKPDEIKKIKNPEMDEFGNPKLPGIAKIMARVLKDDEPLKDAFAKEGCDLEAKDFVLGYSMRAGSPLAFDRILGLRFGIKAMELVANGETGLMVSLSGNEITTRSLTEGAKQRVVDPESNPDLLEMLRLLTSIKR